jgi:PEP-CTERM motif
MKRAVMGFGIALALMPSVASAALFARIQDKTVDTGVAGYTPLQTVDLVFEDTSTGDNEMLFAYDFGIELVSPTGATPIGFSTPAAIRGTDPGFIFQRSTFRVTPESRLPTHVLVNAENTGDPDAGEENLSDITTGERFGRLQIDIPASAAPGVYTVRFVPIETVFSTGDENRPSILPFDVSDVGTITVVPEPGSLSLLAIGGLLALRRRRTA